MGLAKLCRIRLLLCDDDSHCEARHQGGAVSLGAATSTQRLLSCCLRCAAETLQRLDAGAKVRFVLHTGMPASGTGQGRQHWPVTVSKCLKLTPHCRRDLLSLRGFLGCCSVTALFFATKKLPVADATVFSFLAPVIVAVLSPIFLQESSKGAWVAIAGCSFGVLLVAQPGFLFGSTRLSVFGVCLGIIHSTASGTAKVLCSPFAV